jgi:DNA repair protein RecO (recombination protein O)
MLLQTRGIVLKTVKYSDTSVICKIFTEDLGIRSYIINGIRSSKSKQKASLVQPLNLLHLVVYQREFKNLQRIKELRPALVYQSLPFDMKKGAVALFIIEILNKALKEETGNPELFEFVFNTFRQLDETTTSVALFHHAFLLHFSRHLGFYPGLHQNKNPRYFDMQEGVFLPEEPRHPYWMDEESTVHLLQIIKSPEKEPFSLKLPYPVRKKLLNDLLQFYALHIENFGKIHSHSVLETVFAQ